jgi:hypothetical protein
MSSQSEKGHAKNVANFTDLFHISKGFGSRYQPAYKELELAQVEPQLKEAERLQKQLNDVSPSHTTAVARKDKAFELLDSRVTRALGIFAIGAPLDGQMRNAQTIANSIKGQGGKNYGKPKAGTEGAAAGKGRSNSQRSMDMRVENLYRLIAVFTDSGTYATNETDLTLPSLTAYANELKNLSEAVVVAETPEADARKLRDAALYTDKSGLVDKGYAIKRYIRSAFGPESAEYRSVKHIKFSKPRKRK